MSDHHGHREIGGIENQITQVWPTGEPFLPTREILEALTEHDPERWGSSCCYRNGLTAQRMGRYLFRELGIKAGKNGDDVRGYHLEDFTGGEQ